MVLSQDLKTIVNLRRLRNVKRCNNFTTLIGEDVVQHSYFTTLLAVLIAKDYNLVAAEHNKPLHHYDDSAWGVFAVAEVMEKGFFHDIEESYFSDIPHNIKHDSEELHAKIEEAVHRKFSEAVGDTKISNYLSECNANAKDGSFEGDLIDTADMLELAVYCAEEVDCGNSSMQPLLDKAIRLVKAKKLHETLSRSPLYNQILDWLSLSSKERQGLNLINLD